MPRPYVPTSRNLEVLAYRLAYGSRKGAAEALGISLAAVERHFTLMRVGSHAADDAQLGLIWHDALLPFLARISVEIE